MLKDTRLHQIRVSGVMVENGWRISFSAEISETSCSIWPDRAVSGHRLRDISFPHIIGHHELYLNITDEKPRATIEDYLMPLLHLSASMAIEIADIIEEHLPLLRSEAERAMQAAQVELDRPPAPKLRWKKGDRVIHLNRPATVQRTYRTGKVHIVLDSSDHLAAWYVTRIVGAKNLQPLEE